MTLPPGSPLGTPAASDLAPEPTDSPRRYARGRATREEIVHRAREVFATHGYRGASLREIATRCNVGHSALLYHFPTKADLLMAVLTHREMVDARHSRIGELRGIDALQGWVLLAALNTSQRGIVELFTTLAAEATNPDHPAHHYFVERYRRSRLETVTIFDQVAERGLLRPGFTPASASAVLIATMDGLQIQWLLDPTIDLPGLIRDQINAFLTEPLPPMTSSDITAEQATG